ncbi:MAG TPA: hypothetical protein VKY31_15400 [Terriglobia bacterium]|nr:hypothetical protein [Terriglobia bacterium]
MFGQMLFECVTGCITPSARFFGVVADETELLLSHRHHHPANGIAILENGEIVCLEERYLLVANGILP